MLQRFFRSFKEADSLGSVLVREDILPVLVLLALPSEPPAGDGEAAAGQGARRVR